MHNFTHEDFIKYYYNETTGEESIAIKALLKNDAEFQKLYEEVIIPFSVLIDINNDVSEKTIGKIIHYATKVHSKLHLN